MHYGVVMFPTDYAIRPDDLARAAEERGFESLWVPEHTHIPASRKSPWPGGPNLPVAAIGDPVKGEQLFETKACVDCHSFNGEGGEDAPPLDPMTGHLSAREIAAMSGQIWNHLPEMLEHFEEEGIAFPTFSDEEMADLIAYLHGGAPAGTDTDPSTGTDTGMQMETGSR